MLVYIYIYTYYFFFLIWAVLRMILVIIYNFIIHTYVSSGQTPAVLIVQMRREQFDKINFKDVFVIDLNLRLWIQKNKYSNSNESSPMSDYNDYATLIWI